MKFTGCGTEAWAALCVLARDACAGIVGRLGLAPLLAVLIQKGRSIHAMDVPTCVQSPIIVQSHESEVRPGRIVFPLLPLRIFGNTSADPSRCLADPLVAHEALLDLDIWSLSMNVGHLKWHGSVGSIWLTASLVCAVASWAHGVFVCAVASGLTASCGARWHLGLRLRLCRKCSSKRGRSVQIMDPRVAPMVCKGLSNHSIFPKKFRLEGRELKLPLVGYPAPSFSRIVDSSGMIQTNKFCFPEIELPCVSERQSTFSSTLCPPVSLLIP